MNPRITKLPQLITIVSPCDGNNSTRNYVNIETVLCVETCDTFLKCKTVQDIVCGDDASITFFFSKSRRHYRLPTDHETYKFIQELHRGVESLKSSIEPDRKIANAIRAFMSTTLGENYLRQYLQVSPALRKLNDDNDLVVDYAFGKIEGRNVSCYDSKNTYTHGDVVPGCGGNMFAKGQLIRVWFDGPMIIMESAQDNDNECMYPYARYEFPLAKYFTTEMRCDLLSSDKHGICDSWDIHHSFLTRRSVSGEEKAKKIFVGLAPIFGGTSDRLRCVSNECIINNDCEYEISQIEGTSSKVRIIPRNPKDFSIFVGYLVGTIPDTLYDKEFKFFDIALSEDRYNNFDWSNDHLKVMRIKNPVPMYLFDVIKRNKFAQYIDEGTYTALVDNFDIILDNSVPSSLDGDVK